MSRKSLLALVVIASVGLGVALGVGLAVGLWLAAPSPRSAAPHVPVRAPEAPEAGAKDGDGLIELTDEQIAAAQIETAPAGPGLLTRRMIVPATIAPDPDKIGRVAAKVAGTVAELRKKLGDNVALNEVIAIIDSREVADAKSEYLAAQVNFDLQSQLYQRDKGLYDKKIIAEQLFLKAKATFTEARLKLDVARQKLAALDLSESELANLSREPVESLRRKEIRAPIAGRVIERKVNLGQPVGGEGQTKELFTIADLSKVEANLAVPAENLQAVHEGQGVRLTTPDGRQFEGKVAFVNAMITPETRTGHVIAYFPNPDFALRPGSLMNAEIALEQTRVKVRVPRSALQLVKNETIVFVRTPEGFAARRVEVGAGDDDSVEIRAGLTPGERIAIANTFVLKADLGKREIPEE